MQQTIRFYDRIAPWYSWINRFLEPQKVPLAEAVNALSPGDLLEIGVGTGSYLHRYHGHRVTGIDTSEGMLQQARKRYPDHTFRNMSGEELDFWEARFDTVVMAHVVAVVQDASALFHEADRVLCPGGHLLILNHFTPENLLGRMDRLLDPLARWVHLRSAFFPEDLPVPASYHLESRTELGRFGYYQLRIYRKP